MGMYHFSRALTGPRVQHLESIQKSTRTGRGQFTSSGKSTSRMWSGGARSLMIILPAYAARSAHRTSSIARLPRLESSPRPARVRAKVRAPVSARRVTYVFSSCAVSTYHTYRYRFPKGVRL